MDDKTITALAREYAEEIYPNLSDKIISLRTQEIKNAERLIRFLLRRYCLVEKSKVRSRLESAYDAKREERNGCFGIVRWNELHYLFPEIAKEMEG